MVTFIFYKYTYNFIFIIILILFTLLLKHPTNTYNSVKSCRNIGVCHHKALSYKGRTAKKKVTSTLKFTFKP